MIAAALVAAAIGLAPGTDESFESMTALPSDWKLVEYKPGVSKASIRRGRAADGKQFVRLSAPEPNHTRLFLPAQVEPGASYRFSMMVRARGAASLPAVLGVNEVDSVTTADVPGDGEWVERELYIQPGKADKITLVLSLGRFGQVVAGNADFDVLRLEKVDAVPADATVAAFSGVAADEPEPVDTQGPSKAVLPLTAVLAVLVAGVWGVLRRGDRVG